MMYKKSLTILIYIFAIVLLNSCYLVRIAWWNTTDMKDYKKFHSLSINNTNDNTFHFFKKDKSDLKLTKLSFEINNSKVRDLNELLVKTNTLSFMIIRNDTILYEKYFKSTDESTIFPSFSVSKSYISALIGIAIDEGYIKSVNQPITDYLTELKDKKFKKVTIEHLLNMKTGIKFNENYSSPFSSVAKYYYGRKLKRYIKHLKIKEEPGQKYEYVSVSTLLLSLILEKATGMKTAKYLEEKIWKPLGMEYDASWSIDSKKEQTVKGFCCLNVRTIDYAKFGRLYLNNGKWNNKQIIPTIWIDKSTHYSSDSTRNFYYN